MRSSSNKRGTPRLRRRMLVIFDHDARLRAQTSNISPTGLCIASDFIAAPGTMVGGALALPGGTSANFEGAVIWARSVRGTEALTVKNTMGLEFVIPPGEHYDALFEGQTAPANPKVVATLQAPAPAPAPAPAARPTAALAQPDPVWSVPPVGVVGRTSTTVQPHQLAAPVDRFASSIGPTTAAGWVEQACLQAVAPHLNPKYTTVGVGLQLTVPQHPPTAVGSPVITTARLVEISPDGYLLIFEVSVSDGQRELAFGKHSRQVCLPRG